MTHDDPLDALSRALAITPSPEFAARVRQQIDATPARSPWWSFRHVAAAAAVVGVVATGVMRWQTTTAPHEKAATLDGRVADTTPAGTAAAVATTITASAHHIPVRPRASESVEVRTPEVFAETLVPDDQRIALERLLGAIRAGRATVPDVVADEVVDEAGRRVPRALVIAPLTVELLAGTPVEPNRDPIKDPIK